MLPNIRFYSLDDAKNTEHLREIFRTKKEDTLRTRFCRSEQALFKHIENNIDSILNFLHPDRNTIEIKRICVHIISRNDMCPNCFKTMMVLANKPLGGVPVSMVVSGCNMQTSIDGSSREKLIPEHTVQQATVASERGELLVKYN